MRSDSRKGGFGGRMRSLCVQRIERQVESEDERWSGKVATSLVAVTNNWRMVVRTCREACLTRLSLLFT